MLEPESFHPISYSCCIKLVMPYWTIWIHNITLHCTFAALLCWDKKLADSYPDIIYILYFHVHILFAFNFLSCSNIFLKQYHFLGSDTHTDTKMRLVVFDFSNLGVQGIQEHPKSIPFTKCKTDWVSRQKIWFWLSLKIWLQSWVASPGCWLDSGHCGQGGVSRGILIGMLYSALLSRTPGVTACGHCLAPCPLCVIFLVTAPSLPPAQMPGLRSPAGWKLCWLGPTSDPWQPIRGQVRQLWTNHSPADSLRCDAGYYVWCLGVSQTRHKSYRSHNKEDGTNIFLISPFFLYFRPATIFCLVNIYFLLNSRFKWYLCVSHKQ